MTQMANLSSSRGSLSSVRAVASVPLSSEERMSSTAAFIFWYTSNTVSVGSNTTLATVSSLSRSTLRLTIMSMVMSLRAYTRCPATKRFRPGMWLTTLMYAAMNMCSMPRPL